MRRCLQLAIAPEVMLPSWISARSPSADAFDDLRRDTICEDGVDHYAVAMRDPEGNEFDIN